MRKAHLALFGKAPPATLELLQLFGGLCVVDDTWTQFKQHSPQR